MKNRILPENSLVLVIDIQERLISAIEGNETIVKNTCRLLTGANLLHVPVFISEQYPQGLGPTIPVVAAALPEERQSFTKKAFSCCGEADFLEALDQLSHSCFVICGVETHVCVLQTALDLLAIGKNVAILTDAVGSRFGSDHEIGLRRLEQAGVILATTEMVLFEWCKTADHLAFKKISHLVKSR